MIDNIKNVISCVYEIFTIVISASALPSYLNVEVVLSRRINMEKKRKPLYRIFLIILLLSTLYVISITLNISYGETVNPDIRICPSLEFLENSQLVNSKVFISRSFAGIICYNELHDRVLPSSNKSVGYYVNALGQRELRVIEDIFTSSYGNGPVNESYVLRGYIIDDMSCRRIVLAVKVPNPLDKRIIGVASKVAEHFSGVCGVDVVLGSPKALEASHAIATVLKRYEKEASEQNATYAVGVDLFALTPLVLADEKFISIVDNVKELAQVIASSMPNESWAILVVLSEPLRIEHHGDHTDAASAAEGTIGGEETSSMSPSTVAVDEFSHATNATRAEGVTHSTVGSAGTSTVTSGVIVAVNDYSSSTSRSSGTPGSS
jgi:hypothetical protein